MRKLLLTVLALALATCCFAQKTVIFGDSYSTFAGYIPKGYACWYSNMRMGDNDVISVGQTWWRQVCDRMGYTLVANNSYSGSTVCNSGYRGEDYTDRSFLTRAPLIPPEGDAPEVILILAGTNDSWAGAPIGEVKYSDWTREDSYAFLPSYCQMLDILTKRAPKARIVSIINCELKPEVMLGIAEISLHYARVTGCDVEYLQLQDIDKKVNHPSVLGMKQIADQVCNHLLYY